MSVIVSPSLLAANFLHLEEDMEMINKSKAEWLHLDVMDGIFAPNISFGFPVISALKKKSEVVFDVHLMIENPDDYLEAFQKAGADVLTVHYETVKHLHRTVNEIKRLGMKAGVALNPHTPVSVLEEIISDLDLVLIMSVNPGFGGQKFIPAALNKVKKCKDLISKTGSKAVIEVDGGVNKENAVALVAAGTDVLVAGSAVFKSENPTETIAFMHGL
ncbi:MAG: ribulose-phosphate 3-epimerase [Patiriisocius sp.]|jgi:ribulose-phosphate 3-epimerase